ncbi:HAD-IA family hydrolase [Luedemannella helvata]|uniref:HAD-IA family hydrolase n=1 Tax=Luedemannella helvata TaxID=349315 RepID=A0ABN2KWV6_9ACTN
MTHLVVDLGGVLFRFDHLRRLDVLAGLFGLPAARVDELLWASGFNADCDAGRYGSADLVRARIRATVGFAGTDEELDDAWCAAYAPNAGVLDALTARCDARTLSVFTNNGPLEEAALPRLYPAVFAPFDHLFFTWRLGCRKPDPAAFSAVARALGPDSTEILFVDDSAVNVAAARAVGWRAARFGPDGLECT